MVEFRRWHAALVTAAAAALVALAVAPALAQPPVARPQPPPGTETAKPAQPAAPAPQPTAPAAPATGRPATSQPATTTARPTTTAPAATAPAKPSSSNASAPAAASGPAAAPPEAGQAPSEAYLGVPIMPNASYLGSYDAGGAGQRFFLFGSQQRFAEVVAYYRAVLKDKGELVFEAPATHMFEVGKFREEQVAFPPGVTVKDFAVNGLTGLPNPRLGASPATFPTVIQIVPPAVVPAAPRR